MDNNPNSEWASFSVDTAGEEYLTALKDAGITPENNGLVAGRIPPGTCQGIHPAEYFGIYSGRDLFASLKNALPKPSYIPENKAAFNTASLAATNNSQDLQPTYKPQEFNNGLG